MDIGTIIGFLIGLVWVIWKITSTNEKSLEKNLNELKKEMHHRFNKIEEIYKNK